MLLAVRWSHRMRRSLCLSVHVMVIAKNRSRLLCLSYFIREWPIPCCCGLGRIDNINVIFIFHGIYFRRQKEIFTFVSLKVITWKNCMRLGSKDPLKFCFLLFLCSSTICMYSFNHVLNVSKLFDIFQDEAFKKNLY